MNLLEGKRAELNSEPVSEDDTATDIFITYCRVCGIMHPLNNHNPYFMG